MTSLSELATQVTGRVSDFRRILDFNPSEIPFELPPTIEAGIDRAADVLNLPNTAELRQLVTGELDNVLGGLRSRVSDVLDVIDDNKDEVIDVIQRIDWLL